MLFGRHYISKVRIFYLLSFNQRHKSRYILSWGLRLNWKWGVRALLWVGGQIGNNEHHKLTSELQGGRVDDFPVLRVAGSPGATAKSPTFTENELKTNSKCPSSVYK